MDKSQPSLSRFYEDLRRRKVFRATAIYGVIAWFVIQAAEATFAPLNLPPYSQRLVVILALAGFPVVIVLAWAYDLTRRGLVRTEAPAIVERAGWRDRIVDFVIIAILAVLVVYLWLRPGAPTTASGGRLQSIAVLPFDDFSEGRDQGYFGDGIAEELLNALVGVEGLRVAARTSSFAFRDTDKDVREIGEALAVDTVLEGSVRRSGDRVKITAQLIKVADGFHMWSAVYDRELTDIFAVQEDISQSIAKELKLRLSPGSEQVADASPTDVRAYDLYLLGRHHWRERTRESLERARELFAEAARLDPDYAPAFSGLADTYLLLSESQYGTLNAEEVVAHAEPAIARALELDGDLAEAYASLGLLRWSTGEMTLAQLALRKAVDLNPSYSMAHVWLGSVLIEQGAPILDGEREYRQAYALDPLQIVVAANYATTLSKLGRVDEARAVVERLIEQLPDATKPYLTMAEIEQDAGRLDEAVRWARRATGVTRPDGGAFGFLGKLQAELGQLEEARATADRIDSEGLAPEQALGLRAFLALLEHDWDALAAIADPLAPPDGETVPAGFAHGKSTTGLFWGGIARLGSGDLEGALDRFARLDLDERPFGSAPDMCTARNAWALTLMRAGRNDEARAVLERTLELTAAARSGGWRDRFIGFVEAETHTLLGQHAEALQAIDRAMKDGATQRWYLDRLPTFDPIREDAAFVAVLAQLDATLGEQRTRVESLPADPAGS